MRRVLSFTSAAFLITAGLSLLGTTSTEIPARAALADADADGKRDITTCTEFFTELVNSSLAYEIVPNGTTLSCTGVTQTPIVGFTGSLDGNGATITDINISCASNNCGIFSTLGSNSGPVSISNLGIANAAVSNPANSYTGILVGLANFLGISLTNVSITGGTVSGVGYVGSITGKVSWLTTTSVSSSAAVTGTSYVGGLIGEAGFNNACSAGQFALTSATYSGQASGVSRVGGLIGKASYSSGDATCGIFNSTSSGSVTSAASSCFNIGGMVGDLGISRIFDSSNSGPVTTTHTCSSVGGLVGSMRGSTSTATSSHILRSWNTGTVTADSNYAGGLVGYCDTAYSSIRQSFNLAAVNSTSTQVGGVTGPSNCQMTDSFSRGTVSGSSSRGGAIGEYSTISTGDFVTRVYSASNYGFLGRNDTPSRSCPNTFWDNTLAASTPANCSGVLGKSTADMKTQSTFTNAGWDFTNVWAIDPNVNDGYPFLRNVGVSALPGGQNWTPPDTTAPTVTLTNATIDNTQNAVVESTETGTAYLVDTTITVTQLSDITNAAGTAWNSATIATANTATNLAATGLANGTYKAYATDAAGNLSTASTGTITIVAPADTTAPTVTLTNATIDHTQNAVVESTETGTAYLVDTTITVTQLSDITNAAGTAWNSATIATANTATNLAATGLANGTYKAYATDAAGNLSTASTGTIIMTAPAPAPAPPVTTQPTTTTTPPTTTSPPGAPTVEPVAPQPPGEATSRRSDGTEIRAQVEVATNGGRSTITIRNDDGTMLTVVHEPAVIRTAFNVYRGTRLTVSGDGYQPDTSVGVWLNSTPTHLGGSTTVDNGTFSFEVEIPISFALGQHTLQIEGTVPTDIVQSTFLGVEVLDRYTDSATPSLPRTGRDTDPVAGLTLIALGLVAIYASRRRHDVSGAGTSPIR